MSQDVVVQNMSFKMGNTMIVIGTPTHCSTRFAINVGHSEDELALHLNPRFDQGEVVLNSRAGGSWLTGPSWQDEVVVGRNPFYQGKQFKVKITFNSKDFTVTLPDGYEVCFPNRPGATKYRYFQFTGEVKIRSIEVM